MRTLLLITFLLVVNCKFNKVVDIHGVNFLERKEKELILNNSNKNDIILLLGPPSTKSKFDNDLWKLFCLMQVQLSLCLQFLCRFYLILPSTIC